MSDLILPVGREFHIPGPNTTERDLEDMAYRSQRGRAFKPDAGAQIYLIKPDGQTVIIQSDGHHEIAEIQEFAQMLVSQ